MTAATSLVAGAAGVASPFGTGVAPQWSAARRVAEGADSRQRGAARTRCRYKRIGLATIHVLDASQLDADGTWGVLRAAANPPGVSTQDLIAELNADPRLPKHLKDSITREFMNQHIANTSPAETKTAADIAVELSFQRGVENATTEALSVLMPVARALLTPAELAALGAAPTLAEVRDALRGRVPGL